MLRIGLCDDDPFVTEEYTALLHQIAQKQGLSIGISAFSSGEQLLFELEERPNSLDILFLDILMGRMDGIETARRLRELSCRAELIFLTTSGEYVFQAFDAAPLHYLIKGEVTPARFEEVFLKAVLLAQQKEQECFTASAGSVERRIPLSSIRYFEVKNRIVTIHCEQEPFDFYGRLDDIAGELSGKGFLRTHRSFLVNPKYIERVEKSDLFLTDGSRIPVSASNRRSVIESLSGYLIRA